MTQVFISYSRRDLSFVERLAVDLKKEGFETWFDLKGLEGGERWGGKIQSAIQNSEFLIVVLSPDALQSQWVEREFLYASQLGKKIIPLLYRRCEPTLHFVNLNYIDVQEENYHQNYDRILRALGRDAPSYTAKMKKPSSAQTTRTQVKPSRGGMTSMLLIGGLVVLAGLFCVGMALFAWDRLGPPAVAPGGGDVQPSAPPPVDPSPTPDIDTPNQPEPTIPVTPATVPPTNLPTVPPDTPTPLASTNLWRDNFNDANGWKDHPSYWDTIAYPDVNGDGRADVCGRGGAGINCAISNASSFGEVLLWRDNFSDANGWRSDPAYWGTIAYPDVNGDGRADVCGRGGGGINCALSTGSSFGEATIWRDNFSDANGWRDHQAYWGTIAYPDVNGDGRADVCGRGGLGINCALSTGSSFGEATVWRDNFSDANGWKADPAYWDTIAYPDVNGDGRADVCGRGGGGINCALSTGSSFGEATLWRDNFSDANGWKADPAYWDTIAYPDVNGDGRADVCGRGGEGINCGLSTGSSFGTVTIWRQNFSDANGWKADPSNWSTMVYPDINGDGRADVCGRGGRGMNCAISDGSSFSTVDIWSDEFSDSGVWKSSPAYWDTIFFPDVNGDRLADMCARFPDGIHCGLSTGSSFQAANP